jgi:hypothetical protein
MGQQIEIPGQGIIEFPDGMSDEQIVKAIHANFGAPQSTAEKVADFVPHQAGLLANNTVKGATSIPTMIANIPAAVANGTRAIGNWATGTEPFSPDVPYVDPFGQGADIVFGENGQPRNYAERLEGDVIRPLAGVGAGVSVGKEALKNSSEFIGKKLAGALAFNPALQAQSSVGGGVADGLAREGEAPWGTRLAASILGSIAAPGVVNTAKGLWGSVAPFLASGQEKIVNNALASYAENPQAAIAALKSSPDYVPGVNPTAGPSSGDPGLIGLERTMSLQDRSPIKSQYVANDAAASKYLNDVAGTPADIEALRQAREQATAPLYEATAGQKVPITAINPALANIEQQIAQRYGQTSDAGRKLSSLSETITQPFSTPESSAVNISGTAAPSEAALSHVATIYRQERDKAALSSMNANSYIPEVRKAVASPVAQLGKALEEYSPEFKAAQNTFQDMSVPINQKENMQEIAKRVTGGTTDASGNYFVSPAKLGNLMKEGQLNTDYSGWQKLEDALSPTDYKALENLNNEIARANLVNTSVATRPGSMTYTNLASTNAMKNLTGGTLPVKIPFFDKWLYEGANNQIQEKLAQALLDRQRVAKALETGLPTSGGAFWPSFNRGLGAAVTSGGAYGFDPRQQTP